jgi:5-methylcytosine-specific restriction enzyme subunit McrC
MIEVQQFEHSDWFVVEGRTLLQAHLDKIWRNRFAWSDYKLSDLELSKGTQPFLDFDGNKAKSKNYVGFFQNDDTYLVIHPKIFKSLSLNTESNELILRHLFFWFDYCRRWRFPVSNLNSELLTNINLPELFIKLIANRFYQVIEAQPLLLYTEVPEALLVPKGRINFNRYVNDHFRKGNQQILACDHELLLFDNPFNQTIKFVIRSLQIKTRLSETQRMLDMVLFLLDEVTDRECTSELLDAMTINPFFSDYENVRNLCKMVLNQQMYSQSKADQSQWSLLFPMEYIFEDFIAGFIEQHFSKEWKIEYQKSDMYLTSEEIFQMQHDIFLTFKALPHIQIIIDTKYKLRGSNFKQDKKKGIAQDDLYQMISYAFRRGCKNVLLLYPNESELIQESDTFNITSGIGLSHHIKVTAAEIPFWSIRGHDAVPELLRMTLDKLLTGFINGN